MRQVVGSIGIAALLVTFVGCMAEVADPNAGPAAAVTAEIRQSDQVLTFTIQNTGADSIYYSSAWLARWEGDYWQNVVPDPTVPRTHMLPVTATIPPGGAYPGDLEVERADLPPGEYRFGALIYKDRAYKELLPLDNRTSNILHIR